MRTFFVEDKLDDELIPGRGLEMLGKDDGAVVFLLVEGHVGERFDARLRQDTNVCEGVAAYQAGSLLENGATGAMRVFCLGLIVEKRVEIDDRVNGVDARRDTRSRALPKRQSRGVCRGDLLLALCGGKRERRGRGHDLDGEERFFSPLALVLALWDRGGKEAGARGVLCVSGVLLFERCLIFFSFFLCLGFVLCWFHVLIQSTNNKSHQHIKRDHIHCLLIPCLVIPILSSSLSWICFVLGSCVDPIDKQQIKPQQITFIPCLLIPSSPPLCLGFPWICFVLVSCVDPID